MKNPNKSIKNIDSRAMLKTGFKRSLGLLILFLTVTASSCVALVAPLFK